MSSVRRRIRETRFWNVYHSRRYAILFYALLLTVVALPIASTFALPGIVIEFLLGLCLLAAVMPNSTKRTGGMLFTGVLILILGGITAEQRYVPVNPAFVLTLVGLTGLAAAAGALRFAVSKAVTAEAIYAALSTYLLAGLFFGQIYWSIEGIRPGSIVGPDPLTEQAAVYYSFVTLATLGYGDFLPRTDIARGVATLEVIGGQLFLAVMVARLIGTFDGRGRRP